MMDLTRDEQHELIRLLGIVADNGRGAGENDELPAVILDEIARLVAAAEMVRDACVLDLANQEG